MPDIFTVTDDDAYRYRPRYVPSAELPLAGLKLTDELRKRLRIPKGETPQRIDFPGTRQSYQPFGGYLVPFYHKNRHDESDPRRLEDTLARHNEELIIDRARGWTQLAEAQLAVKRDNTQLKDKLAEFSMLPEDTDAQCAYKLGRFKPLIGSIMVRFERLGRDLLHDPNYNVQNPTPQQKAMQSEYKNLYGLLSDFRILPLLQQVRMTGPEIDRDGVLVDLIREIGKPIGIRNESVETAVRDNILLKISWACESIDQTHALMKEALTNQPTSTVFENALQPFFQKNGARYGMRSTADVLKKLDEFAAICRVRACIKGDDLIYDDVYAKQSVLDNAFNKMFDSMRYEGRRISPETQELRSVLTACIRLMIRTAYTRTPCNEHAPEVLVPNFDKNASPMEKYMVHELFNESERKEAQFVLERAKELPEEKSRAFIKKHLSSLGHLTTELQDLTTTLLRQQIIDPRLKYVGSGPGTDRGGRG